MWESLEQVIEENVLTRNRLAIRTDAIFKFIPDHLYSVVKRSELAKKCIMPTAEFFEKHNVPAKFWKNPCPQAQVAIGVFLPLYLFWHLNKT